MSTKQQPASEPLTTPTLSGCQDVDSYRERIEQWRIWLRHSFSQGQDAALLVQASATWIDALLTRLWKQLELDIHDNLALVAVGGYGRSELHPGSDVDLLILSAGDLSQVEEEKVSLFVTLLWDIKLQVGQSVRDLEQTWQLARDDITIATNLLESRLICGSRPVFAALEQRFRDEPPWDTADFFRAKRIERDTRLARYNGTAYNLEPNLKGNPGGLRDIQLIGWIAAHHIGSNRLSDLVTARLLEPAEHEQLKSSLDFLWRLRFALHVVTKRSEDRLLFDHQPAVAELLGYTDKRRLGVERMMHRYYRCSLLVRELVEMLLDLFAERLLGEGIRATPRIIDDHFQAREGYIEARHERVFDQPVQLLKLFQHVADDASIQAIAPATLRQLRLARYQLQQPLVDSPDCRMQFIALVRHPRGLSTPLTLMHEHGILSAYLPAWHKIVGQMQFDLFHAYTVDEHTYRLMNNLHRFNRAKYNEEFPLCSNIVQGLRKPYLLFLAGLFHDIAKGRGGDHSTLGAEDALEFCRLHGLSERNSRVVAWLVRNHLLMSVTAQRRDIQDPEVVHEFARQVRDELHLDTLYCLTVADIRATNDNLWNSWRASLLRELYFSTQRALRRGLENPVDVREQLRETRTEAERLLLRFGYSSPEIHALWQQFRDEYFLRHTPEQIAWHGEHILKHNSSKPVILFGRSERHSGSELFIYSPDRPNLFAELVGLLDQKRLTIHDAQIMTSLHGYSLDTFVVMEQSGKPVTSPARQQGIRRALEQALDGNPVEASKPRRMNRQMRQFKVATETNFLPSNHPDRTLMELVALDMPGLLAKVGQAFQQCGLKVHSAKIATFGERAEDFFSLSTADDQALDDAHRLQLQQTMESILSTTTEECA